MTKEDIIKLMREAGFVVGVSVEHWGDVPFAKLCHPTPTSAALYRMLELLVSRAVAAEREACAKVCDVLAVHPEYASDITKVAAQAIRARGNT